MSALLMLFGCLALGVLVARYARPPAGLVPALNWWVLRVALPALVLELIPRLHFDSDLWFPIIAIWIVFFGAWLLFAALGSRLGWSRGRIGALVLVCGLGNTTFLGYPLIEALRGEQALGVAVVADQFGSFPLLISVGVVVASLYAGYQPQPQKIIRRIIRFPAFIALLVAIIANLAGGWPPLIHDALVPIGATLTPLALFSVGLQFRPQLADRDMLGVAALGLGWKLLLAPALGLALGLVAGVGGTILSVGVLQAAMAPMVSATILADEYDLDPPLANSILGCGIVLSLLSVPLANLALRALA